MVPLACALVLQNGFLFAEYQPRFTPLSTSQVPTSQQPLPDSVKTTPYVPAITPTPQQKTITYTPASSPASLPQVEQRTVGTGDPVELFNQATELLQTGKTDEAIEQYKASIKT